MPDTTIIKLTAPALTGLTVINQATGHTSWFWYSESISNDAYKGAFNGLY